MNISILVLISVISGIIAVTEVSQKFDFRLYDFMLGLSKEIETDDSIVLVDIDDESIAKIGSWPWSRDILGNALIRMKELEAKTAVFDIEYLSPTVLAVDENLSENFTETFGTGQEMISGMLMNFASEIKSGAVSRENIPETSRMVDSQISDVLYEMYRNLSNDFSKDNDDYFARAIQFFGNASMTINMRDIAIERDEDEIKYSHERFLFGNVSDPLNLFNAENEYTTREEGAMTKRGFVPPIQKIVSRAAGAGFTNVVVDRDGIRRRVELLNNHNGKFTGQLAFAPLMRLLDVQYMERRKNSLVLRGLLFPGENERRDIKIPLDRRGRMIINWLHGQYEDSFNHMPVYILHNLDLAEKLIADNMSYLSGASFPAEVSDDDAAYIAEGCAYYRDTYNELQHVKQSLLNRCNGFDIEGNPVNGYLSKGDYDDYFGARNQFFAELKDFADSIPAYESVKELTELKKGVEYYIRDFNQVKDLVSGAFCLIGNCAMASTDLGVTPFVKRYANLGTHANVVNTIMQESFIREENPIFGIIFAFAVTLAILIITRKQTPGKKNLFGLVYIVIPVALIFFLMVTFKIYFSPVPILFLVVAAYLSNIILNFQAVNKDKKFLQTTFGAYVAPAVVDQIIKNPDAAKLGGENKNITALFSDVKTFSGFTEVINNEEGEANGAVRLVKILNGYLGVLSDAIMDCYGTIDKYVGDEIVSFFGAPINDDENAFHACKAGIRMLQAEDEYNRVHKDELPINPQTKEPFWLRSRVGMNTGRMVVGNMGTDKKLNYTVMGNNVNLASRLEGTNKAYGSWIMCSDSTWQSADSGKHKGELLARKFDCVRVINVKKPVQIHNILGLKSEMPSERIEAAELFNKGMEWYLKGSETPEAPKDPEDFKKALDFFRQAKRCFPGDESSDVFIQRCEDFIKLGTTGPWDGVFTMKSK